MVVGGTAIAFFRHTSWELAALAIAAIAVDIRPFPTPGPTRRFAAVFVSICFTFAIMLVYGLGWAIIIQTTAVVATTSRRQVGLERMVLLVVQFGLALFAAQLVLAELSTPPFALGQRMTNLDGLELLASAATWFVVSAGISVVWLRLRIATSWRQVFTRTLGYEWLSTAALLLLAPLLVGAPSDWGLLLVIFPVFAVSQLAWLYNKQGEQLRLDALTGLLSRQAMNVEIEGLTGRDGAAERVPRFALLVLDLDRFRQVNDALGHTVGDRLLIVVAERLTTNVRDIDLVARLGGDEFAILQPDVPDEPAALALAGPIAAALTAPATIDGQPVDISASIGVALYPQHGVDHPTLIRHAEIAMYDAKYRTLPVAVYTPESDRSSATRLGLLADLRRALEDPAHQDEISFVYQPQVAIASGEVVGVEALLRWQHPERGLVNVEEILEVAEYSPVVRRLTSRVIDDVLDQLARWNSAGLTLRGSINVSVRDLDTPALVHHLEAALRRHRISADQLEVEVTETALLGDFGRAQAALHGVAQLGVAVSLDDFGTGYSSLAHLRTLPISEIKIDRSFTARIATDPYDHVIVRSIIALAGGLGVRVVAEGVEDERTCQLLGEAGCEVGQGWYFARAMPATQLIEWLAQHRAAHWSPPVRRR